MVGARGLSTAASDAATSAAADADSAVRSTPPASTGPVRSEAWRREHEVSPAVHMFNGVLSQWAKRSEKGRPPLMELLQQMDMEGHSPSTATAVKAMTVCARRADPVLAQEVMEFMVSRNVKIAKSAYVYYLTAAATGCARLAAGESLPQAPGSGGNADSTGHSSGGGGEDAGLTAARLIDQVVSDAFSVYDTMRVLDYPMDVQVFVKMLALAQYARDKQAKVSLVVQHCLSAGYRHDTGEGLLRMCGRACADTGLWRLHEQLAAARAPGLFRELSSYLYKRDTGPATRLCGEANGARIRIPATLLSKVVHKLFVPHHPRGSGSGGRKKKKNKKNKHNRNRHLSDSQKQQGSQPHPQERFELANRSKAVYLLGEAMQVALIPELRVSQYLEFADPASGIRAENKRLTQLFWFVAHSVQQDPDLCLRTYDLLPLARQLAATWKPGAGGPLWAQQWAPRTPLTSLLFHAGRLASQQGKPNYVRRVALDLLEATGDPGQNLGAGVFAQTLHQVLGSSATPCRLVSLTRLARMLEAAGQVGVSLDIVVYTRLCTAIANYQRPGAGGRRSGGGSGGGSGGAEAAQEAAAVRRLLKDVDALVRSAGAAMAADAQYGAALACGFARANAMDDCWAAVQEYAGPGVPEPVRQIVFNTVLKRLRPDAERTWAAYQTMQAHGVPPNSATAVELATGLSQDSAKFARACCDLVQRAAAAAAAATAAPSSSGGGDDDDDAEHHGRSALDAGACGCIVRHALGHHRRVSEFLVAANSVGGDGSDGGGDDDHADADADVVWASELQGQLRGVLLDVLRYAVESGVGVKAKWPIDEALLRSQLAPDDLVEAVELLADPAIVSVAGAPFSDAGTFIRDARHVLQRAGEADDEAAARVERVWAALGRAAGS